ncbi:trigger factor [Rhodoligotrophos defluvii]|uniref:trigger factor n=1 Tax=Rhodoligotrophos defluvii TaxID=2561934 RepID=UPI0010C9ED3C|nr:trigger factor [Rhodoligotrophos defluvii]
MQVTETLNEGLKRELKVVVGAQELESQLEQRLHEIKDQVRVRGFRPGKVPVNHLRRLYGRSLMAEVVQKTVDDSSQKAIAERNEKPAYQPQIALPEDKEGIEQIIEGKADLAYTMSFEIVPSFEVGDFSGIELEKEVAPVDEADIDDALANIARNYREFEPRGEGETAKIGDQVTLDFVGKIDGEPFEGGSGTDAKLELGSNSFIPGFEDQLIGLKAGESTVVHVTFPEDYGVERLAGKPATFDVTMKEVAAPKELAIDDEFAKKLGLEDLATLRQRIRDQIASEYEQVSRSKLKRQLLDRLDERYEFALPERLVEDEFQQIWRSLTAEMEREGRSFEDENTTEEQARAEYRRIAERRVRLGLLLGRVGEQANVSITDQELQQAMINRARQFPGQERQVFEFYRSNPQAMLELRGPIFEEKVVDHIIAQSKVSEKPVTREALYADPDEGHDQAHAHDHEHSHDHDHDHAHDHDHSHDHAEAAADNEKKGSAKKKPAAKKTATKKKAESKSEEE